jgi:putative sterol carrier protein
MASVSVCFTPLPPLPTAISPITSRSRAVELARGDLSKPDAKVRSSYHTAARLSQHQLSNQVAFLTGKVKISGNLGALMRHNATLDLIQATLSGLDIDY